MSVSIQMSPNFRVQPDKNNSSVCYFMLDGVAVSGSGVLRSAEAARNAFCPVAEFLFKRMDKITEFAYAAHKGSPFARITLSAGNVWAHGAEGDRASKAAPGNGGKVVASIIVNPGAGASNTVSSSIVSRILKDHVDVQKGLVDRAHYVEQHDEKIVREILKKAIDESPAQKKAQGHEGSIVFKDWEKATKTLVYKMSGMCSSSCSDGDTSFTEAMLARYMQSRHGKYVSALRREP